MKRRACLLTAIVAIVSAAGCTQPTAPYDRAQQVLAESRSRLVDGDLALADGDFDRARRHYTRAERDLAAVSSDLAAASADIEQRIREMDRARQTPNPSPAPPAAGDIVTIGARDVSISRFYTDTLRGYREALALAVVLESLATERRGEALYRRAARQVIDGDDCYRAQQFAAALKRYEAAAADFRDALLAFAGAAGFVDRKLIENRAVAEAAPPGTWPLLPEVRRQATLRTNQADAYRAAVARRTVQARRIVDAYRSRTPGNVPNVSVPPLEPLPPVTQQGVIPPPLPGAALGR